MLWRKMGSKSILNAPVINYIKQKMELEILFGLPHHSRKQYPQMLQKVFSDRPTDVSQSLIDYLKFSTEPQVSYSCM